MRRLSTDRTGSQSLLRACGGAALLLWLTACAATPAPDASGPRAADEQPYPIVLMENRDRRDAMLVRWQRLTHEQGIQNAPAPELQPVTSTLHSLPELSTTPLYLPKIGEEMPMSEEETLEALRRFISDAGPLLCGDRQFISLLRLDKAEQVKEASYEQRPFRYPLRGGYGQMHISFTADRRVLQLSSTCIPDVESVQRALAGLGSPLTAEKILEGVRGQTFSYTDAGGSKQTIVIPANDPASARTLVIYPVMRPGEPASIEFHLAWEVTADSLPAQAIYLDAVTGEFIAIAPLAHA